MRYVNRHLPYHTIYAKQPGAGLYVFFRGLKFDASPTVTFPAAERQRPLTDTERVTLAR